MNQPAFRAEFPAGSFYLLIGDDLDFPQPSPQMLDGWIVAGNGFLRLEVDDPGRQIDLTVVVVDELIDPGRGTTGSVSFDCDMVSIGRGLPGETFRLQLPCAGKYQFFARSSIDEHRPTGRQIYVGLRLSS